MRMIDEFGSGDVEVLVHCEDLDEGANAASERPILFQREQYIRQDRVSLVIGEQKALAERQLVPRGGNLSQNECDKANPEQYGDREAAEVRPVPMITLSGTAKASRSRPAREPVAKTTTGKRNEQPREADVPAAAVELSIGR